jgi:hypothetical protein
MRDLILLAGLAFAGGAAAQQAATDWNAPFPAHRAIDNVYFVGTAQLGSFLISTPAGHIVVNGDFESTMPSIRRRVAKRSFESDDIEILLGRHAHGEARDLPVDVFLGSHGFFYGLAEKYEAAKARRAGEPNPFIDREGYLAHVSGAVRFARSARDAAPSRGRVASG